MEFKRVSALMDQLVEAGTPGNDCAIFYKGEQVFRRTAGVADRETGAPMRPNQRYNIYSATKVLTVTCAMKLIEEGKMALNDPLYKYLPEYEHMTVKTENGIVPARNQITIRNLFCMTAGLSYDLASPSLKACREETGGVCSTRDVVRYLAREPLLYEPGTGWVYSLAHDVLGAVIEVVSGMRFGEYMKKTIFDVCGMKDTAFRYKSDPLEDDRFCTQYVFTPENGFIPLVLQDGPIDRYTLNVPYVLGSDYESGGAGLISTVNDYCKFAAAMCNYGTSYDGVKILSKNTLNLMRTNRLDETARKDFLEWTQNAGFGYGLGVRTAINRAEGGYNCADGTFGWAGAAGSYAHIDPESGIVIFYAQHMHNNKEPYVHPRLRNIVYSCL
jgi:CubicO group peptidase (beta-lactamase class C family)